VGDAETIRGKATFTVGVGDGSSHPVTVVLTASCPPPIHGTQRFPIEGGCVSYTATATGPGVPSFTADGGLAFEARANIAAAVEADDGQVLCGALAPPCP
jgi:hypothetical protein